MYKKRTKLLIVSIVLIPLLLPSCCRFCRTEKTSGSLSEELSYLKDCPKKRVNIGWTMIESGTNETLQGIYGESHSDVITVGENGTIRRCEEIETKECGVIMRCTPMTSKTAKNLRGIHGDFRGDKINLFAVGDGGTIQRYDGNERGEWSLMRVRTTENLRGIWGDFKNSNTNHLAVGDAGTILRYDRNEKCWIPITSNTDKNLNDTWGNIFVVGNEGTILQNKNNKWSAMKSGTDKNLNGLWGFSSEHVFAVGDGGTILHFKGSEWSKMESTVSENLHAVWGRSPGDVFAVGDRGRILHYNGNKKGEWRKLPRPTIENLHYVWISQNPHVFVIGENGIEASKEYAAIWGYILDSTTGDGIEDALVERKVGGQFSPMGSDTDSTGKFDHRQQSLALNEAETFRFAHEDYYTSDEVTIDVADDCWFDIRTYLFPENGYANSISGVISEVTEVEVDPDTYEYSKIVTDSVTVELYKKSCGNYPTTPECYVSTSNGNYFFPNDVAIGNSTCRNAQGLAAGTYKVVPKQSGYTFDPEYNTIDIVVPHEEPPPGESPQAYNFTRQQ